METWLLRLTPQPWLIVAEGRDRAGAVYDVSAKVTYTECGYVHCKRPAKSGARFCCDAHRFAEWDRLHPRQGLAARQTPVQRRSRAIRNGRGTKLYVTPEERKLLLGGLVPANVIRKLRRHG